MYIYLHIWKVIYVYVCVCVCVYTYGNFLAAQLVKNLPAVQETWVWSLGRVDPLEKEMATHSSILACLENPQDRGAWWATIHGATRIERDLATKTSIGTDGYRYSSAFQARETDLKGRRKSSKKLALWLELTSMNNGKNGRPTWKSRQ